MLLQENKWSHGKSKSMQQEMKHDPTTSKAMRSWGGENREHGCHKVSTSVMPGDP